MASDHISLEELALAYLGIVTKPVVLKWKKSGLMAQDYNFQERQIYTRNHSVENRNRRGVVEAGKL